MDDWKKKAENLKDKVAGESKEAYGKVTGDKSTEIEGKVQSGVADVKGNAADAKNDLFNKADTKRDKVVGETKETYGRVTNDKSTEVEGKIQSGGADVREDGDDLGDKIKDKVNDIKNRFKK